MTNKELWAQAEKMLGLAELNKRFRRWIRGVIQREKDKKIPRDAQFEADVARILKDLNERTGARYRVCPPTLRLIRPLLQGDHTVEDFIKVHVAQVARWKDNPDMRDYLRPSTLYRPTHFYEYLQNWNKDTAEEKDLQEKRASAARRVQAAANDAAALEATTSGKLAKVEWHEFETFVGWFMHSIEFPDVAALTAHLAACPPALRKMRDSVTMVQILEDRVPGEIEEKFQELKSELVR